MQILHPPFLQRVGLPPISYTLLRENIRYGAAAMRIERVPEAVSIHYVQGRTAREIRADYAVCAIPFSVLRNLEVYPRFSNQKQRAIRELPYKSVALSFAQTARAFWIGEGLSGSARTDLATMRFWDAYQRRGRSEPRGILQGYLIGEPARWLAAMDASQREYFIAEQAEKVFPGVRDHLETAASVCWDENP